MTPKYDKLSLLATYVFNNRLEDYKKNLMCLVTDGYRFVSVNESLNAIGNNKEKIICLRHDVDYSSPATVAMAEIEFKLGIKATYYFRHSTKERDVLNKLKKMGHEISLHYETLADMYKLHYLSNVDINDEEFKAKYIDMMKDEINRFRMDFDVECRTIAAHGAPENRLLNIPNNYIFLNLQKDINIKIYEYLDVDLEAYDCQYLSEWDAYLSDDPVEINNGWRYELTPGDILRRKISRAIILTHPNHWKYNFGKRAKKIIKILISNNQIKSDEFYYQSFLRGVASHEIE